LIRSVDQTHDPALRCWVGSAHLPGADFPVQNLPFGVFRRRAASERFRCGVAIGDRILDVSAVLGAGLFSGEARVAAECCGEPALNRLMAAGPSRWKALRVALSAMLCDETVAGAVSPCLVPMSYTEMTLPARIGGYTDFFASIHHATNAGSLFRPDNPLLPNYKWLPVAYNGRASSVRVSGHDFHRPWGQLMPPGATTPLFAPTRKLDYELEVGAWIGESNVLGCAVSVDAAEDRLFGITLLNDWSARDLQAWEYQPLGPFLGKSFATTVSPWVITLDALSPFRCPQAVRGPADPAPLPHLDSAALHDRGAIDMHLEVCVRSKRMKDEGMEPMSLSRNRLTDLYWTFSQMVAHHTSNGCNLEAGDLVGSGTLSGAGPGTYGSLLEITRGGQTRFALPSGETRTYLDDADEVTFTAFCERAGFVRIGTGACTATVLPARPPYLAPTVAV
jgi:fumarylacetoacetase